MSSDDDETFEKAASSLLSEAKKLSGERDASPDNRVSDPWGLNDPAPATMGDYLRIALAEDRELRKQALSDRHDELLRAIYTVHNRAVPDRSPLRWLLAIACILLALILWRVW